MIGEISFQLRDAFAQDKAATIRAALEKRIGGTVVLLELYGRLEIAVRPGHELYLLDGKPLLTIYAPECVVSGTTMTLKSECVFHEEVCKKK